jgi:hypothetical protein
MMLPPLQCAVRRNKISLKRGELCATTLSVTLKRGLQQNILLTVVAPNALTPNVVAPVNCADPSQMFPIARPEVD